MKISIIALPIGKTMKVNLPPNAGLLDVRIVRDGVNVNAVTLWGVPLPVQEPHPFRDMTIHLVPMGEDLFIMPGITLLAGQVTDRNEGIILTEGVFK